MDNNLSSFHKVSLTPEEYKAGCEFTALQRAVIQNLIAESAEEKVALTYDALNPVGFAQAEAELHGKIGILKYLLSLSNLNKGTESC
jgi:hypothetical protein